MIDAQAEKAAAAAHTGRGARPGPSRFIVFVGHCATAISTWFGAQGSPGDAIGATQPQLAVYHPARYAGARVVVDLWQVTPAMLYRVLRHEFTHAVDVREQVAAGSVRAFPIWAEEGLACWVEELDLPLGQSQHLRDLRLLRRYWNHQLPPPPRAAFYATGDRAEFN